MQVSENLLEHGLIDAVVAPEDLRATAADVLDVVTSPREGLPDVEEPAQEPLEEVPAWESITRSRRDARPSVRRLLRTAAHTVTPLQGTGEGETDPGPVLALAEFGGAPCVLLGQDRRGQQARLLGPAGLRPTWPRSRACAPRTCCAAASSTAASASGRTPPTSPTPSSPGSARVLEHELVGLLGQDDEQRLAARLERYRRLGLS